MYRTQRGKVPYRHRRSLIVLSCFLLVGWPRTRPNLLYPLGSIQESHDKKLFRNYLGLILTEGRLNAERSLMDFSNATPFSRPRRCATLASIFSHICKKKSVSTHVLWNEPQGYLTSVATGPGQYAGLFYAWSVFC